MVWIGVEGLMSVPVLSVMEGKGINISIVCP